MATKTSSFSFSLWLKVEYAIECVRAVASMENIGQNLTGTSNEKGEGDTRQSQNGTSTWHEHRVLSLLRRGPWQRCAAGKTVRTHVQEYPG